jgi:hypothetical protein
MAALKFAAKFDAKFARRTKPPLSDV